MIVFVTGPPGAGKTTLAHQLAPRLGVPLIAKDDIKESLSDSLGKTDIRWSKKLGAATWDVMWVLLERCVAAGGSAIFESNFYPDFQRARLIELRQRHPFVSFELFCTAEAAVRRRRSKERDRHPVHHGIQPTPGMGSNGPLELDEHVIRLDTTDGQPFDLDDIVERIAEVRSAGTHG